MGLILKIAAGVLLAGIIALTVSVAVYFAAIKTVTELASESIDKHNQNAASARQALIEQKLQAEQRDRKAKELARRKAEYKRAKEAAWRKHYTDPEDCLVFRSDAHMVQCVDAKKRARDEFSHLYDRGARL